ncbi:hypothetical protein [Acinetobacter sp. ANC 5502]
MPNQIQSKKAKTHGNNLSLVDQFFSLNPNANTQNAQDIVHLLLTQSLNVTFATLNCFDDEDGELISRVQDDVIANLLFDIQTKLELIEKVLPFAFLNDASDQESLDHDNRGQA